MADVFLSYSREDLHTARRFAEGLEREGFTVWWDQSLDPGEAFDRVTEKALKDARAVVVLWSKHSVESRWVRAEATQADRNQTFVPVMIGPCDRPIMFELTHTADLSQWNGEPGDKGWQAFLAALRRFVRDASPGVPTASPVHSTTKTATPLRGVAIAALTVALLIAGAVLWKLNRTSAPAPTAVAAAATPAAAKEVTLAVLPFADMSPTHDQEYFSDGLTEEILNQLAQIKDLTVTGRTSSFSFKGKNEDLRVIGEKLGVANLLEGSVRKDGTNLRITAQLISGSNGAHLWSQTYDRELSKVFELQEEIAKDVASALKVKLDVGEMNRARGGTTNLEAYDAYLRGQAATSKGDFQHAFQYFHEAVKLEPGFVNSWWLIFATANFVAPDNPEKEVALQRLEALVPNSWQTLTARAYILDGTGKWIESGEAFTAARAVAGSSNTSAIDAYESLLLRQVGNVSGAQDMWQPLVKEAPSSLLLAYWTKRDLFCLGRNAEGLMELDRGKTLPGYQGGDEFDLLVSLRFRKDVNPATTWSQYASVVSRDPLLQSLAAKRSDPAAARMALHRAFDKSTDQEKVQPEQIAAWADYFGDRDLALAAMRQGLLTTKNYNPSSLWLPFATNLRTDQRFKDMVRELGLVDYWRKTGKWGDFCKPMGTDDFECH